MAIAYIQGTTGHAQGVTSVTTSTFSSPVTTGNQIIVTVGNGSSSVTSMTDSTGSNTYKKAKTTNNGTDFVDQWYAENVTGGNVNITVNVSGSTTISVNAQEFSGLASSNSLDRTSFNTGSGTAANTGNTAITTQASELLVGSFNNALATNWVVGTNYSNMLAENNGSGSGAAASMQESQIVSSTSAYSATATLGSSFAWQAVIATYGTTPGSATSTSTSSTSTSASTTSYSTSSTSSSTSTTQSTSTSTSTSFSSTSVSSTSISTSSTSSSTSTSISTSTTISTSSTSSSTSISSSTSVSSTSNSTSTSMSTSTTLPPINPVKPWGWIRQRR